MKRQISFKLLPTRFFVALFYACLGGNQLQATGVEEEVYEFALHVSVISIRLCRNQGKRRGKSGSTLMKFVCKSKSMREKGENIWKSRQHWNIS